MGKKGERTGTKSKPKPRLAIYAGAAGASAVALGLTGQGFDVPANVKAGSGLKAIGGNVYEITTRSDRALPVAVPLAAGLGVSWLADKVGINKMLARAHAPFRV